jgi:hypothetical protein
VELVRLVVKLEVPVAGLRVVVLLTGNDVVMVLLEVKVELTVCVELIVVVVLDTVLVKEVEIPLAPVLEVGKL